MEETIAVLESPIDVMYLLHKGLSAQAERVQKLIENFEIGGSLQSFTLEFDRWAIALAYHAQVDDEHMTAPLTDCAPARDNETEHEVLAEQLGDMASLLEKDDKVELELVRRLLIDDMSDDSRWVLDWLLPELTRHERELIAGLESEFQRLPAAAD